MNKLIVVALFLLSGCVTNAELERPEDVTGLRASYTQVSVIYKVIAGGTDVCQVTALGPEAESLLADYSVVLDKDGCAILPKTALE